MGRGGQTKTTFKYRHSSTVIIYGSWERFNAYVSSRIHTPLAQLDKPRGGTLKFQSVPSRNRSRNPAPRTAPLSHTLGNQQDRIQMSQGNAWFPTHPSQVNNYLEFTTYEVYGYMQGGKIDWCEVIPTIYTGNQKQYLPEFSWYHTNTRNVNRVTFNMTHDCNV